MRKTQKSYPSLFTKTRFWLHAIVFIFPVIIYSNTISHKYALDDTMVITHNSFTQKGFSGLKEIFTKDSFTGYYHDKKVILPGGRYRPFSIATFAIEHEIFGPNPHISHLINILLYAFTGIILYRLLNLLFKGKDGPSPLLSIPLWATLIFLAHPVHTEVVANIKGRDEIFSLLLALSALISVVKYADNRQWPRLLIGFAWLFLALLSKENAITFVLILPLSVYFFRDISYKQLLISSAPAIAAVILYFLIRHAVTGGFQVNAAGELMNNPFVNATANQKYATTVLTLGLYLKLLFWPHPLTFDYYPYHIGLTGWQNFSVIITLAVYLALIIYAFATFRERKPVSYSILFFMISLMPVSNLFINMGTFMNERFIYQASVGFVTGISTFLLWIIEIPAARKIMQKQAVKGFVFTVIIGSFSAITFARNFAWKDDMTLFLTDVKTSANSAKSNCGAGGELLDKAVGTKDENAKKEYLIQSLQYLTRATTIDPTYSDVWRKLGTVSYELDHNAPAAFRYYYKALSINRGDELACSNIHYILMRYDSIDQKIGMYKELLKIIPGRPDIHAQLGLLYGKGKKDYATSIAYFKQAIRLNPDYKEAYKGLGVAFLMTGEYEESIHWLETALLLDTLDASIYRLIGNSLIKTGNADKAALLFSKADKLKKGL